MNQCTISQVTHGTQRANFQNKLSPWHVLNLSHMTTARSQLLTLALLTICIATHLSTASAFSELKGTHFRACTLIESPYVLKHDGTRTRFAGVAIDYLRVLQENLQFTYDLELWTNGSFNNLVEHFHTCSVDNSSSDNSCACDIAMASIAVTVDRVERVQFVDSFAHEDFQMVTRIENTRFEEPHEVWFLFHTFSRGAWLLIVALLVSFAIGTLGFETFVYLEDKPKPTSDVKAAKKSQTVLETIKHFSRIPTAVLVSFLYLIGYPHYEREQNTPSFHKTAWMLLGLTAGLYLLEIYKASLVVLLFLDQEPERFDIIADIEACNISPDRIGMVDDGAAADYWNLVINTEDYRQRCKWETAMPDEYPVLEGFKKLENEEIDYYFALEGSILFETQRKCDRFIAVGEPFFSTDVSFIMPQNGNTETVRILSEETRKLREADEYPSARRLAFRRACERGGRAPVDLKRIRVFFFVAGACWCLLVFYRAMRWYFLRRIKARKAAKSGGKGGNGNEVTPAGVEGFQGEDANYV